MTDGYARGPSDLAQAGKAHPVSTLTRGWAVGTAVAALILTTAPAAPLASAAPLIPDDGLRACVSERLKLPVGSDPTADQLATVTDLSCVNRSVASLEGIEHLTGLTELILSTNQITDLTPLSGLTGLNRLLLPGNPVSDPAPLATLTSLRVLSLDNSAVTSLTALAPLTGLTDLSVAQRSKSPHPGIDSLDGVQHMTGLSRLVANNSRISDLGPLAGLTKLQSLHLLGNQISDLTPLTDLTGLTSLGLSNNQITSVAPLAGMSKLTSLDLGTNRIADLTPLGSLDQLGFMGLKARWQSVTLDAVPAELVTSVPSPRPRTGGPAVTLTPPAGITVDGGRVTYPSPGSYTWTFADGASEFGGTIMQPVTEKVPDPAVIPDAELRSCIAEAAGSDGVPTRADVAGLSTLSCADRGITDLDGLADAVSLASLDLSGNPLGDLGALGQLPALRTLDLSRTGLARIDQVASLRGLDRVDLDGNHLRDLTGLTAAAASFSALDQTSTLPEITGDGAPAPVTVVGADGARLTTAAPAGVSVKAGVVTYPTAGSYTWSFSHPSFSGKVTQKVTRDRPAADPHAGAAACLAARNVWVVVERDTGLQSGGCATRFATGLEALHSAGFATTGDGFIRTIGGHPTGDAGEMYWSYWQANRPSSGTVGRWTYSQLGASQSTPEPGSVEGWRFVSYAGGAMADPPSWRPSFPAQPDPTVTPRPTGSPAPTRTPRPTASPTPSGSPTPRPSVDVYSTPGYHQVNGRRWLTTCEPYSRTVRCRTEVWATQVSLTDGRYVQTTGWAFNNLTYQPLMTRAQWAGNPLARTGEFTSAGRRWRTECDTALTGRGGCRSFIWQPNRVAATRGPDGRWRYAVTPGWVFNNLVRFG